METWQAIIEVQEAGLARAIGVSNFQPAHLRRIVDETGVTPAVNQIELHPYFQQAGLRREHADRGIVTEAWSPLAQGAVLDDPVIGEIAEAHGKTPGAGRAALAHPARQRRVPEVGHAERIAGEHRRSSTSTSSAAEMEQIERLDRGERIGADPDTFVRP